MKTLMKRALRPFKHLERAAPAGLKDWGYGRNVDLAIDPVPFDGFSAAVKPHMQKVATTHFYRYEECDSPHTRIPGWLSQKERQILYALGRWLPGPITEIGSWCGLSTTAIAHGIKDSKLLKEFRTYDLVLTKDQFRPVPGGMGLFLPHDDISHGLCTEEGWRREIRPILTSPGGSNGVLKRSLANLGLLDIVEIFTGDFREANPVTSSVLFCDCLHDQHEVAQNAPSLRKWLRPGSILACHDLGGGGVGNTDLISSLREHIHLGHGAVVDTTYIAEVIAAS